MKRIYLIFILALFALTGCRSRIAFDIAIIPDGTVVVDRKIIDNSQELSKLYIPNSVKEFSENCFFNYCVIREVHYNGTLEEWLNIDFKNEYSNPLADQIYYPSLYLLNDSGREYELKDLIIPDGIKVIKKNSFCKTKFKYLYIPKSVIEIEDNAFSDSLIDEVLFENGSNLKRIGAKVFMNTRLRELSIPSSVEEIGRDAILCRIDKLELPLIEHKSLDFSFLEYIGAHSIRELYLNKGERLGFIGTMENVERLTLSDSFTTILSNALFGANSLKEIRLGLQSRLNLIEEDALRDCEALMFLILPNNEITIQRGNILRTNILLYEESPNIKIMDDEFYKTYIYHNPIRMKHHWCFDRDMEISTYGYNN